MQRTTHGYNLACSCVHCVGVGCMHTRLWSHLCTVPLHFGRTDVKRVVVAVVLLIDTGGVFA